MSDLGKRLEAAGRREAEEYFKAKMPHLWKEYELDLERSHTMKAYVECHRSLNPLILKMAEALEECRELVPNNLMIKERYGRVIVDKALAELEKYLGGV